ncbi:MAG: hypothetical protein DRI90_17175 [Deltaproteobacteria bacterium]|nr:MAG: hypothetical protein DRI90_17175 [Deltaproteobacteria bacterium]
MNATSSPPPDTECFGHAVPPFAAVFPKVFRAGLDAMTLAQIDELATALSETDRQCLADFLGPRTAETLAGLPKDKIDRLATHYQAAGDPDEEAFRAVYPQVAAMTNNVLSVDQLRSVLTALSPEDMASQSFFFGDEGRAVAFSTMKPDRIEATLDHTADWVLLASAKRAIEAIDSYTATLEKQERMGRKMQGVETIAIKVRQQPCALYMKWLAGPHKGRELIYNAPLLGTHKVRVREAGLLGVMPVTIAIDGAAARRGTNHLVTEVGLQPLVQLIETDYQKAAPRGDIQRRNHGIADLDGRQVYRMESILPRDPTLGYFCHRIMHYTDYIRGLEVKIEVYNFDNKLDESHHYRDIDTTAPLTEADFDPQNRANRL